MAFKITPPKKELPSKAKAIFSTVAMMPIANDLYGQAKSIISSKLLYEADVSSIRAQYGITGIRKIFKKVPDIMFERGRCEGYEGSYYYDVVMYDKMPILLKLCKSSNGVFLYTFNKEEYRKKLDEFVVKLKKTSIKCLTHNKSTWGSFECGTTMYHTNRSDRTFQDVFIPKEQRNEIIGSIKHFKERQSWYREHHIPYHFGIMLYGPPGTGKSSIISSIANEFNFVPYFVSPGGVTDFLREHNNTIELFSETDDVKMIVVEDLDSCDFLINCEEPDPEDPMERMERSDRKKAHSRYLSDFLNVIDGTKCMQNVLWVFTTNNFKNITPSLIRPGRVDLTFHIDYANKETVSDFLKYHFGREIKCLHVRDNLSFAEMQTDIMRGLDFETICEKYSIVY